MAEEQQLLFEDIFGLNILVLPVNWRSSLMSSSYFSRISSKLINFTEDEYIKGFAAAFEIKLVEKFWKIVLTSTTQANWKKKIFCRKILALLKDISDTDAYDHICKY